MAGKDTTPVDTKIIGPTYRPEGDALSGIERYMAIEEIRLTKARYCAAVDDHDWRALRSVFTDDCVMDWPLPGREVKTPDQFVNFLAEVMPAFIQTRHHAHNLQVEFTSKSEAIVRLGSCKLDVVRGRQQTQHSPVGPVSREVPQNRQPMADRIFQRAEVSLFNSPAAAKRRRAGIGDGGVE